MAVEFKKLAGVDIVETATDAANVLIEENGVIKRVPKTEVGGSGGEPEVVIITHTGSTEHIGYVRQKMIDSLDNNVPTVFYLKGAHGIHLVSSITREGGQIYFEDITNMNYKITDSNTIEPVI